jgi:hypothetical protein
MAFSKAIFKSGGDEHNFASNHCKLQKDQANALDNKILLKNLLTHSLI